MWRWPLKVCPEVPMPGEEGAFGAERVHDIHTGVDLYCAEGEDVLAVEDGVVVDVVYFTGPRADSPWWNETYAVLVRGASGVVVYGELQTILEEGDSVVEGRVLGQVMRVLRNDKGKPTSMLHLELYETRAPKLVWWRRGEPRPVGLLDPTQQLLGARRAELHY